MLQNKRGNINTLTAVGWTLVSFGIIVGLGVTVLDKFGQNVGGGANTTVQYVITQLGSSGLTGWLPVLIVVIVSGLIFALFGMKGKSY